MRLIEPDDAAYIYGLRVDPTYNTHLSEVRGTVEDQRHWIDAYKTREAEGKEFYFIVERSDGTRCGTVRVYGIEGKSFTWGSWILDQNKTRRAALETAWLVYTFGFETLGMNEAHFDVRKENTNTLAFHRRFGATELQATAEDIYFVYPSARFATDRAGFLSILQEEAGS